MSKDDEPTGSTALLTDAYEKVSDSVTTAYARARDVASDAASTTVSGIEGNPLAALIGGLVIGAAAGALIPRSAREKQLLDPVGARIGDAARAGLDAGKTAGLASLTEAGLSADNLRAQAAKLVGQVLDAASTAGSAALDAARETSAR
ncbi:hypothetical protein [Sphingomonas nostoxanthinifaciens]|uniref:hypothetical protein n=1 Tax=Sphingomonas nostoxanthinifaciens TaxID=2872652 RepID=UPI001CC20B3E|nr:hypothetical protein [Sphingomonas nostoxanthinifaciens]UAK23884.1 hypothetical protein K8P63_16175 [Sphingomonas nostoxanthinifaciens]